MDMQWLYRAEVCRVVDGDSVICSIDCGFNVILSKRSVRLLGVDISETRGGTDDLKALGNLAKKFVEERLPVGSTVLLRTSLDKKGKFGRILAEIHLAKGPGEEGFQEKTLNEMLLDENLGVRYSGQSKEDIINQHLINVEHHRSQGNL